MIGDYWLERQLSAHRLRFQPPIQHSDSFANMPADGGLYSISQDLSVFYGLYWLSFYFMMVLTVILVSLSKSCSIFRKTLHHRIQRLFYSKTDLISILITIFHIQQMKPKVVVPWKQMIGSVPVWSLLFTNVFFFAAYNSIAVNMPIFMKDVLGLAITEVMAYDTYYQHLVDLAICHSL